MKNSIYDFQATEMNGQQIDFSNLKSKVIIIVNTASKCGFAPQLKELENLYQKYHQAGLEIIGFPSNQFHQEIAENEINGYCKMHFGVTFPITKLVAVNGKDADPIFTYLEEASKHGKIKWNFTKFLVGKDGQLIHRYAPITSPNKMEPEIIKALAE